MPCMLMKMAKSNPEPLAGPTFFSLGAIAVKPDDAASYINAADKLKNEFFGRVDFTFHEPYMRNHDGLYYFNGDEVQQNAFDDAINNLIRSTPFVAFGVGVRKHAYASFMDRELDPYLPTDAYSLAIDLLMERYVDYLATGEEKVMGRVTLKAKVLRKTLSISWNMPVCYWTGRNGFRLPLSETGLKQECGLCRSQIRIPWSWRTCFQETCTNG